LDAAGRNVFRLCNNALSALDGWIASASAPGHRSVGSRGRGELFPILHDRPKMLGREPYVASEPGEWDFSRCSLLPEPTLRDVQNRGGIRERQEPHSATPPITTVSWP